MKSIGSRITLWYAITLTATLAGLFIAGHYLLQGYLVKPYHETELVRVLHEAAVNVPHGAAS